VPFFWYDAPATPRWPTLAFSEHVAFSASIPVPLSICGAPRTWFRLTVPGICFPHPFCVPSKFLLFFFCSPSQFSPLVTSSLVTRVLLPPPMPFPWFFFPCNPGSCKDASSFLSHVAAAFWAVPSGLPPEGACPVLNVLLFLTGLGGGNLGRCGLSVMYISCDTCPCSPSLDYCHWADSSLFHTPDLSGDDFVEEIGGLENGFRGKALLFSIGVLVSLRFSNNIFFQLFPPFQLVQLFLGVQPPRLGLLFPCSKVPDGGG